MKVLIYKRTHRGDPDQEGIFGNEDCMGRIRNWNYDAVIGIGGKTPWKGHEDIRYKINWVGLNPKKVNSIGKRADSVVFSNFELYEELGKDIEEKYPRLFKYMYGSRKRFDMTSELPEDVFEEVQQILLSVENCPPSRKYALEISDNIAREENRHFSKCKGCFNGKDLEVSIEFNEIC
jgi:hypothetical protein